jgi:hypothetical protein
MGSLKFLSEPQSLQVVTVAFEATGKLRMGCGWTYGASIRMMAVQTVLIVCYS